MDACGCRRGGRTTTAMSAGYASLCMLCIWRCSQRASCCQVYLSAWIGPKNVSRRGAGCQGVCWSVWLARNEGCKEGIRLSMPMFCHFCLQNTELYSSLISRRSGEFSETCFIARSFFLYFQLIVQSSLASLLGTRSASSKQHT